MMGFHVVSGDLTHFSYSCCHDQVKEEMLFEALTTRKTITVGEKLIVPYKLSEVRLFSCSADMKYQNSVCNNKHGKCRHVNTEKPQNLPRSGKSLLVTEKQVCCFSALK